MGDAYGPSNGALLRRALLLTIGCGAAAYAVPKLLGGSGAPSPRTASRAPSLARARQSREVAPPVVADESTGLFDGELTYRAGPYDQFFVTAAVNGVDIPFVVDTGAFKVALRPDDAQSVGFDLGALRWDTRVATANGYAYAASVTLGSLRLDRITEYSVPATVMRRKTDGPSLLGMSFLSRLKSWRIHDGVLTIRY